MFRAKRNKKCFSAVFSLCIIGIYRIRIYDFENINVASKILYMYITFVDGCWLYWGLTPLKQLRSYHGGRSRTCVCRLAHTSTNTTFFPKPPTTFLTCLSRSERQNTPERKLASAGYRTHNHQVMSQLTTEPSRQGYFCRKRGLLRMTWVKIRLHSSDSLIFYLLHSFV